MIAANPLVAGESLLKKYKAKLQFTLEDNELDTQSIHEILETIQIDSGLYLSLNPTYEKSGESFANFVNTHQLSEKLISLLPKLADKGLYTHQNQGIESILNGNHTIISTGTGSGKTETFLIPIIAQCLKATQPGVKAIIIYPMNALAADQVDRIGKYTEDTNITFGLYTGASPESSVTGTIERRYPNQLIYRDEIRANPPDILITNYVMLDRMLTRMQDHRIFIESTETLQYIVLDELHTYTGSKATHLKYLLARLNHYWKFAPVYIGTSATLASDKTGKARLDRYIQELFEVDVSHYTFIEAVKDSFRNVEVQAPLLLSKDVLDRIDFSTEDKAARSIGLLTGQNINAFDFYSSPEEFHKTLVFQSLLTNYYVDIISKTLEQGAQSYKELLRCISQVTSAEQFYAASPDQILSKYLEAITYINGKAGDRGKPLLDYRLHVFFQNPTGTLKLCPNCHRYYSGGVDHCFYDGHILFAVYRHDIRLAVGKFNGQALTATLDPESTDHDLVHYVLIGRASDHLPDDFKIAGNLLPNGRFEGFDKGSYRLAHLNSQNNEQLVHDLIYIGDEKRDYLYLVYLIKTLLQNYGKSLGFVDNRELASRYSSIIRDEFTEAFLYEFLKLNYPRRFEIDKTLLYLQRHVDKINVSDLEYDIFNELSLWFHRMVAIPERMGGRKDLLQLKDDKFEWESLNQLQHEILTIFIRERAIDAKLMESINGTSFIRFQRYWATSDYGIFIEDTSSIDPAYKGVSLNSRSRIYADFIKKWTSEAIQQAIEELVELGVLGKNLTSDSKSIYQIKPEYLCFNLSPSAYGEGDDGYLSMKKDLLFRTEVHSSDLQSFERENIEMGLKEGDINFVVATPTLEMGIDIGDLENVLMIGAPPSPASYAQRAGRAGRGTNHEALIVTFCSPFSTHDNYAFRNPSTIINGRVAPPSFNPCNPEIVKQHINAFLLGNHLKNRKMLYALVQNPISFYRNYIPQMRQIFGDWFDYQTYQSEFILIPDRILKETEGKRISLANHCYQMGIFPDYGFRRDQVIAVDVDNREKFELDDTLNWKDYALTTRDVEQAFRFFVPNQTLYIAGDIYKTLNDGIYDILPDGALQYTCFYAKREVLHALPIKEIQHLDLQQYFTPAISDFTNIGEILAIGYTDSCQLSFRNYGIQRPKSGSSTSEDQILIGYDLKRAACVLRFKADICDRVLRNSLVAVLVRVINERYGLAKGEISLMLDVKLTEEENESQWLYSLLYDNDGNSNLPLRDIIKDFDSMLVAAYDLLSICSCETDGCYNCIRSYNTQYIDETLSKSQAKMFVGYLLDKNRFLPMVEPFVSKTNSFDLKLSIQQQNNEIIVTSSTGNRYRQNVQDSLNDAIFIALEQALYSEYQSHLRSLIIETWVDWLANAINNRNVNKGKEAFNRFQFALVKFNKVEATHKVAKRKVLI